MGLSYNGTSSEDDSSVDGEWFMKHGSKYTIFLPEKGLVSIPKVSTYGLSVDEFLDVILKERGYETKRMPSPYVCQPTEKQVHDYDMDFVAAVRASDVETISKMLDRGHHVNACNKFGESIIHIACRRGNFKVLEQLVSHGATLSISDDYGRTPMHDACWNAEPCFDVVALLLNRDLELLRVLDKRGATPLSYVRPEHYAIWCAFLDYQKDVWWK